MYVRCQKSPVVGAIHNRSPTCCVAPTRPFDGVDTSAHRLGALGIREVETPCGISAPGRTHRLEAGVLSILGKGLTWDSDCWLGSADRCFTIKNGGAVTTALANAEPREQAGPAAARRKARVHCCSRRFGWADSASRTRPKRSCAHRGRKSWWEMLPFVQD